MRLRIDSHQHFWRYSAAEYPWLDAAMSKLRRNFLPEDLETEQRPLRLDGSIAVQARQTTEESRWLLHLADQYPAIKGVVGWVDLCSDKVEADLAGFAKHPKFAGVRHVVQDEPDDEFMLRPEFLRGLEQLRRHQLTYDLLIYPKHLPAAMKVARRFPEQKFVLDHIAKPAIKTGKLAPWDQDIRELARSLNVWCKVSGMVTEARWIGWKEADFRPYLDLVFEAFGEDRLMFGSDWPVCLAAGSYEQVFGIIHRYLEPFPERARRKVFGENAARFYNLKS